MHFHVGHNVAGYMPEADVSRWETFEDAKRALIGDLLFAEEYALEEDAAEAYSAASQDANLWSGADTLYVDERPNEAHNLPIAYWVVACQEDCEEE